MTEKYYQTITMKLLNNYELTSSSIFCRQYVHTLTGFATKMRDSRCLQSWDMWT